MPLWVWNDELKWSRLNEQLTQFKAVGFGGVFVHPRPGLITEYLGKEWFDLWRSSVERCRELGLQCNIYDENSYPSGFAGGHVPSAAPDTVCQYASMNVIPAGGAIPRGALATFRVREEGGRIVAAEKALNPLPSQRASDQPLMVFQLRRSAGSPWTGDLPYVDLTNPETARIFIATTYERYRNEVGSDFGRTVIAAFTDEPLLATTGAYEGGQVALPLSHYILSQFCRRYGYDLADGLPSLFADVGDFHKVRFDYWGLLHDLWRDNFMCPLYDWCERHGLKFTGHYMEHEWPAPYITPDDMSLYACFHIPGIDLLLTSLLKPRRKKEPQHSLIADDSHILLTMRMLLSAANQLGRKRTLAEMWGAGGWDSTLEDYKRMGEWALAHGINFLNPHLSFITVRGARKRDHAQSFSDHSAWWPEVKGLNDRLSRLSYVLSQGIMPNRLLVLQPTTSGFLHAAPGTPAAGLSELRRMHGELVQALCDGQVDFDLGDEYLLEELGRVEDGNLIVGEGSYELVVLPRGMVNLRRQTLPLLREYLAAGGETVALGDAPRLIDGRESEEAASLSEKFRAQWHRVESYEGLLSEIKKRLPPYIELGAGLPSNVSHHFRLLDDGSCVHFIFNGSGSVVDTKALIEGKSLEFWDPDAGSVRRIPTASSGSNRMSATIKLEPTESVLLIAHPEHRDGITPSLKRKEGSEEVLTVEQVRVIPASRNVLVLDYCDVNCLGIDKRRVNTWRANWDIWHAHGFDRPAWEGAVQFRTRVLDRNHFGADSGFEATFIFDVTQGVDVSSLELAVERPELYSITLNDRLLDFRGSPSWLDPHIPSLSVGGIVKTGQNIVRIEGRPFDVRMELENIYIRGNFSLAPAGSGFRVEPAKPLGLGSWSKQGYPFYSETVNYEAEVDVSSTDKRILLQLTDWSGSASTVLVDGRRVGFIAWPPYECDLTEVLSPGSHRLVVSVAGTPKNIFGPFHNPARPRNTAWPEMWSIFPETGPPPGKDYDVIEYGVFEPMRLVLR
jgi:hypothetical protein